jgi:pSer/pThr/pTyr-binding forkhead associated (FHA) protein
MAKLVILNQGMTGRVYDLKVGRTSIGRLAENSFEIPDSSVSSRHCEIHWRSEAATDFFFRDLGSTNGSWINDDKVSEAKLNIGQTFRIGQVEIRIVDGQTPTPPLPPPTPVGDQAPAPAPSAPPPPPPVGKKQTQENTVVVSRGVSLEQLEQGNKTTGFDANAAFTKKKSKVNLYFIIGGVIAAVVIGVLLIVVFKQAGGPTTGH